MATIVDLTFAPFDVALREPFGIAQGAQHVARNVLVEVVLSDGTRGLGEAAPFPAVNGETQEEVLATLPNARQAILGLDASRYRNAASAVNEALKSTPSALAAVETALLDAIARRAGLSLFRFFGGTEPTIRTDITITTGGVDAAILATRRAREAGFDQLKIKVGGRSVEEDVARIRAIHAEAPEAMLLLDANASMSAREALSLLRDLGPTRDRVALFEQPTAAEDLEGLAEVEREGGIPVAADESARSRADVAKIAKMDAARVINIKITKTGILEAMEMIFTARAFGLGLMIGGMVETELCMTTSACLAAGIGGFRFFDLDTPLFLAERPLAGGFEQAGPTLRLDRIPHGHGVVRT